MNPPLRRLAATTAGALAAALAISSATPAAAQDIDVSSLGEGSTTTALEVIGSLPVGSTAGLIGSVGSADFPLDAGSTNAVGTPRPVDPSITSSEFLGVIEQVGAYEYWLVTSRAMSREVVVEVVKSRVEGAAPVLYLLDGVDSPEQHSGWRSMAKVADRMAGENVHVVAPTGAYAANWTDWEAEDPKLGYNKWETFLTEELPEIVETQLETSGKNAIGGVSMGGQAAMHLAATHEMYDAVMAFSGYYSTMDPLGYQTLRLTIETRGGDASNMWGPHGSDRWQENDTISHVDGLDGKRIYFSAGNGVIGADDLGVYGDDVQSMAVGLVLERGVLEGSKAFGQTLQREGIDHRADYSDSGLHNWVNFMKNFDTGWEYIKPALQD